MNEKQNGIPARIKELREILGLSAEEMAGKLGIAVAEYLGYENGEKDIPIGVCFSIAAALKVDYTVLLTGEGPRMSSHTVVRSGEGVAIDRFEGYHHETLAFNFKNRVMEPMLVTLDVKDRETPLVVHGGQEFNYCLKGNVRVTVGKNEFILSEGDSIYFNPQLPHGQNAVNGTAKFLTVITE
ncbi:MAG: cupin domain-containing protein [Oscillospiraceae bacterium]|nr:cupin domain-containing protein [Oscillospiraceae bacterium]